jgi:hypothetical protein
MEERVLEVWRDEVWAVLDAVDLPTGSEAWFYTDWKSRGSRFCNGGWTS